MSKVAKSFICRGCLNPVSSAGRTSVDIGASAKLELVDKFCYRAMLCIRGTSHGPLSVCLCLCLCLSQAGVLLKRQNVGSHKQHHTIPQGV